MTVNADLEPKTHHQTPMTCTYGYSHFRHFQNCCKFLNTYIMLPSLLPVLEVPFSVLKKGVSQYCFVHIVYIPFKYLGLVRCFRKKSPAHQGCNYLINNTDFFFCSASNKSTVWYFSIIPVVIMASLRAKGCAAKTAEVTGAEASEPGRTDALLRGFHRGWGRD